MTESNNLEHGITKLTTFSFAFLLAFSSLSLALLYAAPVAGASSASFAFTNYELGRSNYVPFPSPPDTCPNGGPNCWNWNAEPNIATAPDGSVYVSSENAAFNHFNNPHEGCNIVGQNAYTCGGQERGSLQTMGVTSHP